MAAVIDPVSVMQATSSSAAGVLAYLEEDDVNLKVRALEKIYKIIDLHWAEICNSLPLIEELSEDSAFPAAELAAAVASQCFYHLQEYNDALRLALCAGSYLDISAKTEYVETILSRCIDEYKALRVSHAQDSSSSGGGGDKDEMTVEIDPRMESIIEQMFQRCYRDLCFEQALGVALDTRRLDKVEETVRCSIQAGKPQILEYAFHLCQSARNITPREFRLGVIEVLVRHYGTLAVPDYSNVVFGLQYLDRAKDVADTLDQLLKGSDEEALLAFQIAFDLQESENQGFVLQVIKHFPGLVSVTAAPAAAAGVGEGEGANSSTTAETSSVSAGGDQSSSSSSSSSSIDSELYQGRINNIKRILVEGLDIDLTLNFLFKQSHTDLNILRDIKTAIEGRSSVLHNATIISHAFMNSGTTRDSFLRDNLDWLGKAKNWAKFTTVGSIGVVHKGHVHESMNLLQPYLPQGGQSASPYSEAGALYALGLIHANKGGSGHSPTITYLSDALRNCGNNEIVQHGACLGMGLAAMATGDVELFESLRSVLFADSAVGGEGAAFAIGLIFLGQYGSSAFLEEELPTLLTYLHDTNHEKIIRALALSVAMMTYGKEESAETLIEQLLRDRDPIVRYGGCYSIAMAYCGTADNASVRRLLHVAVSDVNDDVRRAAVSCLGFVMFRQPEAVPKLVSLLAESFNAHVRYGACIAVGVACAGTAFKDAIDLLQLMLEDSVDFVRQGAMLAMAMVLQQASETRSPSVKKFKDLIKSIVTDKHQPVLAKSGAIVAAGILEAGGCNVVVSMQSRAGFMKMGGAVGVMMFLQHWYWYPLMPFLSLAFNPTMLIGLNKDFDMPVKFEVTCNAPPSMFAYPMVEEKKEDEKKLVATAVLSTTARAKAREARKEAKKLGKQPSMDSTDASGAGAGGLSAEIPMERVPSHLSTTSYLSLEAEKTGDGKDKGAGDKPKKTKEPSSFQVANPARVIPAQTRFLSLQQQQGPEQQQQQRYVPVCRPHQPVGIVMLKDTDPSQPEEVTKVERVSLGQDEVAAPPEPFEWDPNAD